MECSLLVILRRPILLSCTEKERLSAHINCYQVRSRKYSLLNRSEPLVEVKCATERVKLLLVHVDLGHMSNQRAPACVLGVLFSVMCASPRSTTDLLCPCMYGQRCVFPVLRDVGACSELEEGAYEQHAQGQLLLRFRCSCAHHVCMCWRDKIVRSGSAAGR